MNCLEFNLVLDSAAPEALTSAQQRAIDEHLKNCDSCRDEWANWNEVAALAIPRTPLDLSARVAAALPLPVSEAARRRPILIGGLLVAGAALAASVVLQLPQSSSEPEPTLVESSADDATERAAGIVAEPESESATSDPVAEALDADSQIPAVSTVSTQPEPAVDPLSIVVLARPEEIADAAAIAELTRCHDAIVRQLENLAGLNVIAGAETSPFEGSGLSDQAIALALGAGSVLVIDTMNGCYARHRDSQTGELLMGRMNGQIVPPPNGWEPFGTSVARGVRDELLRDPASIVAEAKATVLNTTLSDGERIDALGDLRQGLGPIPGAFDSAVVAAAAQIGMSSPDAAARASAWVGLRNVDDPYLVQPLLQSLANDADADVRHHAAFALHTFLDVPGVKDALLRAAAEDPSREATVACCLLTVREAAERASIADAELPNWARRTLLDESLPARSRLLPIASSPDGRFVTIADLGDDAATAIFEIGRTEDDPGIRRMAWNALAGARPNHGYAPALIEDLTTHRDESVRAAAAQALRRYTFDAAVREALEQARNDDSMSVRGAVASVLDSQEP